jgi:sarcosine oxidase delta subunit
MFTDGIYLRLSQHNFLKLETNQGYWVATKYVALRDTPNGKIVRAWTDTETGRQWIEPVRYLDDKETALALAKRHHQLAIWDNANQKEIRLWN